MNFGQLRKTVEILSKYTKDDDSIATSCDMMWLPPNISTSNISEEDIKKLDSLYVWVDEEYDCFITLI